MTRPESYPDEQYLIDQAKKPPAIVTYDSRKIDKYGRSLGELVRDDNWTSLNQFLLNLKIVKPYDGEGPRVWSTDELAQVEEIASHFLNIQYPPQSQPNERT